MRKEYRVTTILAVAAIPVGLTFMVVPMLFPDLSRITLWCLFFAGPVISLLLFGLAVFVAMDRDPAARWRREARGFRRKITQRSALAIAVVAFLTWFFWPTDPLRNELPGSSIYVLLVQDDVPDFHRRYIYQFGSASGPRFELFVSASNGYTFAVTDIHGETYPLEMTISAAGIPIHELVGILTEIGITPKSTILRVAVNGAEVARRTLPFPIDISSVRLEDGHIGSNQNGEQHGNFLLKQLAIWPLAVSNGEVSGIDAQAKKQNK